MVNDRERNSTEKAAPAEPVEESAVTEESVCLSPVEEDDDEVEPPRRPPADDDEDEYFGYDPVFYD